MHPPSTILDIKSIKTEIVDLAKALAESQSRLQQLAQRLEEKERLSGTLESRYEELEKLRADAVNSAKWLNAQNRDLQLKLDQSRPEFDRLLSAKESAFSKLKHARKVIRDLLEERGDMISPRPQEFLSQEDIKEALNDQRDGSSSSSNDSASDQTVRLRKTPPVHPTTTLLKSSTCISSVSPPITSSYIANTRTMCPVAQPGANTVFSSSSQSPLTLPTHYESMINSNAGSPQRPAGDVDYDISPNGTTGSPNQWYIQYNKPPGSMALECPLPIPPGDLQTTLSLDDDTMQSLDSIMSSPDICMRLHIVRLPTNNTAAFLYDPIFAETRQLHSYIVDWGRQQTNHNLQSHILQHKAVDPIFHVFIYPVKTNKWYYIGPMDWSVVESKKSWPLEGKSRAKIISKLCKRSRGQVESTEMETLLDGTQLQQVCVEIKGLKDNNAFAGRVFGNYATPLMDSRHAERSA